MHPLLRLVGPIAIVSVALWCAFGLLVFAIGPGPKVSPTVTVVTAIDQNVPAISFTVAKALPISTAKSDRLPSPAESEPAIKPAEAIDYEQREAEKRVRSAHAESPDLCQRYGMHKVWTKDGKSWRCRR